MNENIYISNSELDAILYKVFIVVSMILDNFEQTIDLLLEKIKHNINQTLPKVTVRFFARYSFEKANINWIGSVDYPERSIQRIGSGVFQGVNIEFGVSGVFSKKYLNLSLNRGLAYIILHGSAHNIGINHVDHGSGIGADATTTIARLNPTSLDKGGKKTKFE